MPSVPAAPAWLPASPRGAPGMTKRTLRHYAEALVCILLDVEAGTAADSVRSAEPLWDAIERAEGLVDSWGGGEFCHIFPRVLAFIQSGAVGG